MRVKHSFPPDISSSLLAKPFLDLVLVLVLLVREEVFFFFFFFFFFLLWKDLHVAKCFMALSVMCFKAFSESEIYLKERLFPTSWNSI